MSWWARAPNATRLVFRLSFMCFEILGYSLQITKPEEKFFIYAIKMSQTEMESGKDNILIHKPQTICQWFLNTLY